MTSNRFAAVIALGMLAASAAASASPTADGPALEAQRTNEQFLITLSPAAISTGIKYGARLICGSGNETCIASAEIHLTLTDKVGRVLHSYDGDYSPNTPGTTWKVMASTDNFNPGTYCSSVEIRFERADGSFGNLSSAAPLCATID